MKQNRKRKETAGMNFLRYLGPGLLVTVGFIDPGNWASNIAAGSGYGYELLWMVTVNTPIPCAFLLSISRTTQV